MFWSGDDFNLCSDTFASCAYDVQPDSESEVGTLFSFITIFCHKVKVKAKRTTVKQSHLQKATYYVDAEL